jgi:hypothetical protein
LLAQELPLDRADAKVRSGGLTAQSGSTASGPFAPISGAAV